MSLSTAPYIDTSLKSAPTRSIKRCNAGEFIISTFTERPNYAIINQFENKKEGKK